MQVTTKSGVVVELADRFTAADAIDVDCMVSQNINDAALSKCYVCAVITKIGDLIVTPRSNATELQSVMSSVKAKDLNSLMAAIMATPSFAVPGAPEKPGDPDRIVEMITAKFGKLAELNALEASNVDTFRPIVNSLSLAKMYAIASIRSIDGRPVNPLEMDAQGKPTQFNEIAESITLGEINGLLQVYNMDEMPSGEALKNSSSAPGASESQS